MADLHDAHEAIQDVKDRDYGAEVVTDKHRAYAVALTLRKQGYDAEVGDDYAGFDTVEVEL